MKKFLSLIVALLLLNSCVQDDDYATPPFESYICSDEWTSNKTIPEIISEIGTSSLFPFEDSSTQNVIEGYVISSDETGNFYKTISIQTDSINPSRGIQIELNKTNLFNNFPLGSKIRILLNGINGGIVNGAYKIGGTYNGSVGQLDEILVDSHVKRACQDIVNITPVSFSDIASATTVNNLNILVKLDGVQFKSSELGNTYADAGSTEGEYETTNRTLEDQNGNEIILRNSGYANFAATPIPEGSGSIIAVLSRYNSDWQLFIRDTSDVVFDQERFGDDGSGEDGAGSIGGGNAEFSSCLSENFESYDVDNNEFPAYFNEAVAGTRYWQIKEFDDNNYIQMSSFNADENANETYFIVPVDFSTADSFSFKTKDGYDNGDVLNVFYATNYTLGQSAEDANLVDITSSFSISSGNSEGYGSSFIESGSYSFSSLSGNGALFFKYTGSESITTTMQIDDIRIVDSENPDCTGGEEPEGTIFEDGFDNLNNWTAVSILGEQEWDNPDFGNPAPCARMNGYSGGAVQNEDWLVSNPIAVSLDYTNVSFSFETDGRYSGNELQAYYTTNYTGDVSTTIWTELDPTLDADLDNWNTWTNSGNLNLSTVIGQNLVIAFKYTSTTSAASTWEVDNVLVSGN